MFFPIFAPTGISKGVNSQTLQFALRSLDTAFLNFFEFCQCCSLFVVIVRLFILLILLLSLVQKMIINPTSTSEMLRKENFLLRCRVYPEFVCFVFNHLCEFLIFCKNTKIIPYYQIHNGNY